MEGLREYVEKALRSISQSMELPQYEQIVVAERSELLSEGAGRICVKALRSIEEFEPKFREMLILGYSWLNLSCEGLVEDKLVFTIEHPHQASCIAGGTSVNFSGPMKAVQENQWQLCSVYNAT